MSLEIKERIKLLLAEINKGVYEKETEIGLSLLAVLAGESISVSIHPIDVRKERARLLEFFSTTSCGDTDATRMLEATFRLLRSGREYMNADVLWISDFKIPLSASALTNQILEYRKADTRFYGLQIGIAENEWTSYFNHISRIDYTPSRRY